MSEKYQIIQYEQTIEQSIQTFRYRIDHTPPHRQTCFTTIIDKQTQFIQTRTSIITNMLFTPQHALTINTISLVTSSSSSLSPLNIHQLNAAKRDLAKSVKQFTDESMKLLDDSWAIDKQIHNEHQVQRETLIKELTNIMASHPKRQKEVSPPQTEEKVEQNPVVEVATSTSSPTTDTTAAIAPAVVLDIPADVNNRITPLINEYNNTINDLYTNIQRMLLKEILSFQSIINNILDFLLLFLNNLNNYQTNIIQKNEEISIILDNEWKKHLHNMNILSEEIKKSYLLCINVSHRQELEIIEKRVLEIINDQNGLMFMEYKRIYEDSIKTNNLFVTDIESISQSAVEAMTSLLTFESKTAAAKERNIATPPTPSAAAAPSSDNTPVGKKKNLRGPTLKPVTSKSPRGNANTVSIPAVEPVVDNTQIPLYFPLNDKMTKSPSQTALDAIIIQAAFNANVDSSTVASLPLSSDFSKKPSDGEYVQCYSLLSDELRYAYITERKYERPTTPPAEPAATLTPVAAPPPTNSKPATPPKAANKKLSKKEIEAAEKERIETERRLAAEAEELAVKERLAAELAEKERLRNLPPVTIDGIPTMIAMTIPSSQQTLIQQQLLPLCAYLLVSLHKLNKNYILQANNNKTTTYTCIINNLWTKYKTIKTIIKSIYTINYIT